MTRNLPNTLMLAVAMALPATATLRAEDKTAGALAAFKSAGPQAKLMIYPVQVLGRPSRNVADAVGLVLEKYGMKNLDATDAAFTPPDGVAWDQLAPAFGDFLKNQKPNADFALYAEYLGNPKTGPTEVRWLIVDAQGRLVLSDRQTKTDRDFKRTAGRDPDPMGCSVCVAERLFSRTGWKKDTSDGDPDPNGRFARIWAEKSGTPTQAEREAMKPRLAALKSALKKSSITVYPTRLGEKTDPASAQRLADALTKQLGVHAAPAAQPVDIQIAKSSNEQKLLWDLARAFREHLRTHPAEGDYALLADDYLSPKGQVGAVHFVLCNRSGDWVIVDFQNNQWPDFQKINPKSVEDCDHLVMVRMRNELK